MKLDGSFFLTDVADSEKSSYLLGLGGIAQEQRQFIKDNADTRIRVYVSGPYVKVADELVRIEMKVFKQKG